MPPGAPGLSSPLRKGFRSAEFTERATNFQMCDHSGKFSSRALRIIVSPHTSTASFLTQLTVCEKLFNLPFHNCFCLWCAIHREPPYLDARGWWNIFCCLFFFSSSLLVYKQIVFCPMDIMTEQHKYRQQHIILKKHPKRKEIISN